MYVLNGWKRQTVAENKGWDDSNYRKRGTGVWYVLQDAGDSPSCCTFMDLVYQYNILV